MKKIFKYVFCHTFKTRHFFCSDILFAYIKTDWLLQDLQNHIPSLHMIYLLRYLSLKCSWLTLDLFVNSNLWMKILVLEKAELSKAFLFTVNSTNTLFSLQIGLAQQNQNNDSLFSFSWSFFRRFNFCEKIPRYHLEWVVLQLDSPELLERRFYCDFTLLRKIIFLLIFERLLDSGEL